MSGLLFSVFDFVARNRWAQWVLIALVTILTLGFYLAWRDNSVRKRERDRQEIERAREQVRITEKRAELQETRTNEVHEAADAADAHVVHGTVDELRQRDPGLADLVYGTARRGVGKAESR